MLFLINLLKNQSLKGKKAYYFLYSDAWWAKSMQYLNLSGYKFLDLMSEDLNTLTHELKKTGIDKHIKGSIILSHEGINLFIAGKEENVYAFIECLTSISSHFSDIWFKKSFSDQIPFKRFLVKVKNEIITMKINDLNPQKLTAPYLEPEVLQEWYKENKSMVLLDTRNDYEYAEGSFKEAIHLNIKNFSEFPDAINQLPEEYKNKTLVTFCTGGIRCEKAAAYLLKEGFSNVFQLKGGIIHYFEKCGNDHYQGNCFVFDERNALDHRLLPASSMDD